MADISTTTGKGINRAAYNFQSAYTQRVYNIDIVADGVSAVATHTLASIEAGLSVVGVKIRWTEALSSTVAGVTATFTVGTLAVTGAVDAAGSVAGTMMAPPITAINATAGVGCGTTTAAITVTMAIGTQAAITGKFLLVLDLFDWSAHTTNG